MGRLIEVQHPDEVRGPIVIQVGDMLRFNASGGRLLGNNSVLEWVGNFSTAVLGTNGEVVSAVGGPNTVYVRAVSGGSSMIEVIGGDPWHSSGSTRVKIEVT